MNLVSTEEVLNDAALVGGKGMNLQRLVNWGANVPPFIVINTLAYKKFKESGRVPPEVKETVIKFLEIHKNIAVRSSMVGEDHQSSSFAGMFETLLGVTKENWEQALEKIYSSVDSERVREYLIRKQIMLELNMAVVIQQEITVEKSGVLFSRSPVTPTSAIAIDAAYGKGEGVVSGLTDVDNYLLSRTGEVLSETITGSHRVLNSVEMALIVQEGLRLEEKAGMPVDIEWGLKGEELFIFQIRPITRAFTPLKVFVDTNLSESYPGTVSPFTANFVKNAYENVFTESAMILGASGARLRKLKIHYAQLISDVDDHLYYDLEHYYAVLRSLPGGEKNIENWHKMIGGKIDGLKVPYHHTALSLKETILAMASLAKVAFSKNGIYQNFLKELSLLSKETSEKCASLTDSKSCMRFLSELIGRRLGFGLTVVNDVYIMIGLGILTRSLKKRGVDEGKIIDLLKTEKSVDSIRPLKAFNDLVQELSKEFLEELELSLPDEPALDPYSVFLSKLEEKGRGIEVKLVRDFISNYGDRSFEELKIESLPLKNDPGLFKKLVNWGKNHQQELGNKHCEVFDIDLNFFERRVMKFTRECIEMREASRLWRGKFYHHLREVMLRLADLMMKENTIWKTLTLKDFFSISHHEWIKFADGKFSESDLMLLMNSRSAWKEKHFSYPEVINWAKDEKLPIFNSSPYDGELKGQGVSAGKVTARALVLDSPTEAFDTSLDEYILVTKNTDPAWVYIMSRSKGLVSEKGSLLSHTAIIGRELNIPTLVGVKSATSLIKSGDFITINGTTGEIKREYE